LTSTGPAFKPGYALPSEVLEKLRNLLGERFSTGDADLLSYSHDYWPISLQWVLKGSFPWVPSAVAWPENTFEVQEIVKTAYGNSIPVYAFGGGSGVLGGTVPEKGGIVVDLKRMRSIRLNEEDMVVEAEAGVNGYYLEKYLNSKGYTLGHIPQSIYVSTLGGWIATKATGQFSTKYGGIEDMVLGLEAVLPWGSAVTLPPHPRTSTGPDLRRLFIGSEGVLGIVTRAWLKTCILPEERVLLSYVSETFEEALESVRRILKRGAKPAVVRVYDEAETKRHFYMFEEAYGRIMTVIVVEGDSGIAGAERRIVEEEFRGRMLGEEPVKHWLETRFMVKEASEFAPLGVVFDTIEVSVGWSRAMSLYRSLVEAVRAVKGTLFASAHASHFYPQGVCFYFTFAGVPRGNPEKYYNDVWEAAMKTTLENGGSISHHHGVGRQRRSWLKNELGPAFNLLKKVKTALDDKGVMNPGNMGL